MTGLAMMPSITRKLKILKWNDAICNRRKIVDRKRFRIKRSKLL
jgi:hypothetical protein